MAKIEEIDENENFIEKENIEYTEYAAENIASSGAPAFPFPRGLFR